MHSALALDLFIKRCKEQNAQRILDIGAGVQLPHTKVMRQHGLTVETNDVSYESDHKGLYHEMEGLGKFDAIWASHVLEHQRNPGVFLDKVHSELNEGGVLAITVPPRKDQIVGGHVTLWNAGLLLYQIIIAGFNCREAAVATYDYNVSVVLNKVSIEKMPDLWYDRGDIDKLKNFFPKGLDAKQGFNGVIERLNWE